MALSPVPCTLVRVKIRSPLVVVFLWAGSGAAQESRPVVLGAGVGLGSFTQGSQAPPLCCGERDDWSSYGPELRLQFGYLVLDWLEPGLDVGVGRYRGTRRELDVALTKLEVAPRIAFRFGDPLTVAPRVGWHVAHIAADFDEPTFSTSESALFMGPGLGLSAGYRLVPELAVGADAGFAIISANADASQAWHAGLLASWRP